MQAQRSRRDAGRPDPDLEDDPVFMYDVPSRTDAVLPSRRALTCTSLTAYQKDHKAGQIFTLPKTLTRNWQVKCSEQQSRQGCRRGRRLQHRLHLLSGLYLH